MAVVRALVFLFLVFSVKNAAAGEHCPYGWRYFGLQCYRFFSASVNWVTAEKNCRAIGANLASGHNTVDHNFLLSIVPSFTHVWIGGHDGEVEGQWLWTDRSQFDFANWCYDQPDNYRGQENCLEITTLDGDCWNDVNCLNKYSYICAKPLRS